MDKKAKDIFEKYNREIDVVRCPNRKAATRKLLDSYARASVNLYGIISRDDFIDIFNKQSNVQTSSEEIYILLLPLVLKSGWYGFYKEYIVHYSFFYDFNAADYLLELSADKPRYVPEKNEFLEYVSEDYEDNDYWWDVRSFMGNAFGNSINTMKGYEEVRNYITYGEGISKFGSIMDKYHLILESEKQFQEFINLIMIAKNNTRIWQNNGYTPIELHEIISKRNENIVSFPTLKKPQVGRNDLCTCGSGKKYKKCCALINDKKTAQLSPEECRLFYETWFGLMGFVNERKRIIKVKIKPEYPNSVTDMMIYKVREVLWEKPELIDDYISEIELSQEKIDILRLWRTNHKIGMFFVLEYKEEYAVVLASNENGDEILYGVKGISDSVESTLQRSVPTQIEAILLPFKGKIIYDSFMTTMPLSYGEGAKASFREMYEKAIKRGIITSLE